MQNKLKTLDDVRAAIAAQDHALKAAFDRLDPERLFKVPVAMLDEFAETCAAAARPAGARAPLRTGVRC